MDKKSLNNLMTMIALPNEIIDDVNKKFDSININEYHSIIDELISKEASIEIYERLKDSFIDDSKNIGVLTIELLAMIKTYERYKELNIDNSIFIDTMKCFKRFLLESKKKNNEYIFDRGWWVYRQLNMSLFRINDLEYELIDNHTIDIHIPSDAKFRKEEVDKSLLEFKKFINKYFIEYKDARLYCDSWLLSPLLKEILNDKSNIISFQKRFDILNIDKEDKGYIIWVFNKNINTPIIELDEFTSLQRKIKELMKQNIHIGSAKGILR